MSRPSFVFIFFLTIFACAKNENLHGEGPTYLVDLVSTTLPQKEFKLAILGDSAHGDGFKKVLQLIRQEKADAALHLGDLAYHESHPDAPERWNRLINQVLGEKYPYLFLAGNHDVGHWAQQNPKGYALLLQERLQRIEGLSCSGLPGLKSECSFRGLYFIFSSIGSYGTGHEQFISHALQNAAKYPWRICAWHKNQRDLQAGDKTDEVGWEAYRLCQKSGAIIATAHEHSYARTRNLNNIGLANDHGAFGPANNLQLGPNKTFVLVSGLGGHSLRSFSCSLHEGQAWWASIFTNNHYLDNGIIRFNTCASPSSPDLPFYNFGVLFIRFYYQGDPRLAKGEFVTIDGKIIDTFLIRNENP